VTECGTKTRRELVTSVVVVAVMGIATHSTIDLEAKVFQSD
jgi:hypothetical protein